MRSEGGSPSEAPPSEPIISQERDYTMKSIFLEVNRLERVIQNEYAQALHGFPVSPIEAHMLAELHEHGAMRAMDLAQLVNFTVTSFTPPIDRLVERELIERRAHPQDRRAILLDLTDAGRALFPALAGALENAHQRVTQLMNQAGNPANSFVEKYAPAALVAGEPY